jgi:hypothetical protein
VDTGLIAIAIGLVLGLGLTFLVRRFLLPKPQQAAPRPPANRQQARKQGRETRKPRR